MRSGRALVPIVMLAVQPNCVFGGGFYFKHDPIAEQLYRGFLFVHLVPIPIIVCGVILAWLLLEARRKARNFPPDNAGSYEI